MLPQSQVIQEKGVNGHPCLDLTPVEYATVNATVYTNPLHPGPFDIDILATQHAAKKLREEHRDRVRIFRETKDVQKLLTKQIVQAIEPKYLNTLRNCTMNNITANIQTILAYLMRHYGIICADTLSKSKQKVREIQYNLLDLLVTLYA